MAAHRLLPPPVISSRPSRHPFEIWVLLALLMVSLSQLCTGPAPQSINTTIAAGTQTLLAAVMFTGSALALAGCCWREPFMSRWLEIAGLLGLSGALLSFFLAGLLNNPTWTSVQGVMLAGGLAVGCLHRACYAVTWIVRIYRKAPKCPR